MTLRDNAHISYCPCRQGEGCCSVIAEAAWHKRSPGPCGADNQKENWQLSYFYTSQDPDFANEEGFCRLTGGKYYLYLNADLPAGRDIWTHAHETAHIVLKHHDIMTLPEIEEKLRN